MELKQIQSLCTLVSSGGTPSRKRLEYYADDSDGHLWVKSKELLDGAISDTEEYISDEGLKKSSAKYFPANTVLLAMYGANVGQLGWLKRPATVNQAVCGMVVNEEIADPRFVFYALLNTREGLAAKAQGAAQQNLNQGLIREYEIAVPELSAQHRIASILSAYDDLIENNTCRIVVLEEMALRLYEEWFVHFQFPGHEEASFDGDLPEGWEMKTLGDVCERITDGAHKSPPSVECGKPMASVKDMHEWGLHFDQCRHISESDYDELVRNSCKPKLNDILIAKDGANLNKHTFLVTEEQEIVLLSSIAILRPEKGMSPEFLLSQLKSPEVSDRIKQSKSGAAIPRIVLKDFKRLQVLVPPSEFQAYWAETAGPMANMCRTLVKQNANLRAQRNLLLPKLVSGQIDVSKANDMAQEAAE